MANRGVSLGTGVLLLAAGALLVTASWQRWAEACPWGSSQETETCLPRQDDRFSFVAPSSPWEPLGSAAELGGLAFLLLAVAVLLLPLTVAPRPRRAVLAGVTVAALLVALAHADLGLATLRSGLAGRPVDHAGGGVTAVLLLCGTLPLYVWAAVASRVRLRTAAGVLLVLGSPFFAVLYSIGSYDDRPWWEAMSGLPVALAGACFLLSALADGRTRRAPYGQARDGTRTSSSLT